MTGKTHRVGGVLCCLAGYSLLQSKGYLIEGVSPLVQLSVMYPFSIYGSIMQDLDHNPDSTPAKDIVSKAINKVLHLTTNLRKKLSAKGKKLNPLLSVLDAKHRSWQTHSDLFLILAVMLSVWLMGATLSSADVIILRLVSTGLILGIISHLVLDMLTPEGIWSILFVSISKVSGLKLPKKIHFVPHSKFFATDGVWEMWVRKIMIVMCWVLVLRIIYLALPYRISFNF